MLRPNKIGWLASDKPIWTRGGQMAGIETIRELHTLTVMNSWYDPLGYSTL